MKLFIAAAFLSFQLASSSLVDLPSNLRGGSTLALEEDYNLDDIDNGYEKEYEYEKGNFDTMEESEDYFEVEEEEKMDEVNEEVKMKMDVLEKEEAIKMKAIIEEKNLRIEELNEKMLSAKLKAHNRLKKMNVRFNKFGILDDTFEDVPLGADSYPILKNEALVTFLKKGTDAESVVNDKTDYEVIYNVKELIDIVGGPPDHPSDDFDAPYWDKLSRVIDMRNKGGSEKASQALAEEMQLPLRWKDFTVDDVAEAVYDEYPGARQAEFLEDLLSGKYGPIQYSDAIPQRSNAQFLRGIIMLAYINTWSISLVGPHNFGAKWFGGRARPEEVAWLIHEGVIDAPEEIQRKISEIENFNEATDFTRYDRDGRSGSPRHPSWPAMHSAGSNMSFWIQVVLNLTPRQLCEAKKVDFAVSFARTVAGVHFEDDNMAGLNMGQEIVARALPEFLVEKYDSDAAAVTALVNDSRFKWEDYQPLQDCATATPPQYVEADFQDNRWKCRDGYGRLENLGECKKGIVLDHHRRRFAKENCLDWHPNGCFFWKAGKGSSADNTLHFKSYSCNRNRDESVIARNHIPICKLL